MLKKDLRILYKEKRTSLTPGFTHQANESICNNLYSNFQLEGKLVSIFLPIENKKEINTYLILEKGMSIGVKFSVSKSSFETGMMKHFQYESFQQIEISKHGIPEPKSGIEIKENIIDVVLVPLFVTDTNGNRVGYGKGFYDRFLSKCKSSCIFIGLSYFDTFEVIDDLDQNDMKLHYLITPNGLHKF